MSKRTKKGKGKKSVKKARKPKGNPKVDASVAVETKPRAKKTKNASDKPKRVSALDAAAEVLKASDKPMRATELIAAMAERSLWSSPAGKTPHATLYAAMQREERDKGDASRFTKVDRGLFEYHAPKTG